MTDVKTGESKDYGYVISYIKNDKLYIAADYIKQFVNFSYEIFDDPHRVQVYTEWGTRTVATIKSDT